MLYWQLFIVFVKIGLLGFGGGMAIISLIRSEVMRFGWISETEFVDIVAISQMTPGPIGLNCATYVGYTASGSVWGSLIASIAIILPSLVIMLSVCRIYDKISEKWRDNRAFQIAMRIIRIAVVVLIAHAAYTLVTPNTFIDYRSWIIFVIVFACMSIPTLVGKKIASNQFVRLISHPIGLILLSGIVGYLLY